MIETMALLGQSEREQMFKFFEELMPQEISPARRAMGVLHVRWMVERKVEDNEEMIKDEAMRNGTRRERAE